MAVKKEVIEKFAIDYATLTTKHPVEWWGKRYNVSPATITGWLQKQSVQETINRETVTFADTMRAKAEKNANVAMKQLMKIVKSEKGTDVQRKACLDVLGLCNMKNVNKEDSIQNITTKNYVKTSNRDLDHDYDKLLGNRKRKKKTDPAPETQNDTNVN